MVSRVGSSKVKGKYLKMKYGRIQGVSRCKLFFKIEAR
jgi:hypothetical protein